MRWATAQRRRWLRKNLCTGPCSNLQSGQGGNNEVRSMKDVLVRIGGEGGEGVISCGELLTTALARSNYEVFTFRTYPAEIKGGPAMFQVRSSDQSVLSQGNKA